MIEEQGRVVAVEPGLAWVETVRASACQSCSANKTCGHAVLDRNAAGSRARIPVRVDQPLTPGDDVVVGIPEGVLVKSALLVYLMPLVLMFVTALLGSRTVFAGGDLSAPFGVLGFVVGLFIIRWYSGQQAKNSAFEPRLLRVRGAAVIQ